MTVPGLLPDDDRREHIAELILRLRRVGITDRRVVAAIESVPRDLFVPAERHADAYAERAVPIDCGQSISAPLIVGMMTAALDAGDRDRVLEIGTGTGYQTAILARLVRRVYTIERFRTLVAAAESRFRTLRISNITTLVGDGIKGWPEQAPFDRIVVTAAAETVPEGLLRAAPPRRRPHHAGRAGRGRAEADADRTRRGRLHGKGAGRRALRPADPGQGRTAVKLGSGHSSPHRRSA